MYKRMQTNVGTVSVSVVSQVSLTMIGRDKMKITILLLALRLVSAAPDADSNGLFGSNPIQYSLPQTNNFHYSQPQGNYGSQNAAGAEHYFVTAVKANNQQAAPPVAYQQPPPTYKHETPFNGQSYIIEPSYLLKPYRTENIYHAPYQQHPVYQQHQTFQAPNYAGFQAPNFHQPQVYQQAYQNPSYQTTIHASVALLYSTPVISSHSTELHQSSAVNNVVEESITQASVDVISTPVSVEQTKVIEETETSSQLADILSSDEQGKTGYQSPAEDSEKSSNQNSVADEESSSSSDLPIASRQSTPKLSDLIYIPKTVDNESGTTPSTSVDSILEQSENQEPTEIGKDLYSKEESPSSTANYDSSVDTITSTENSETIYFDQVVQDKVPEQVETTNGDSKTDQETITDEPVIGYIQSPDAETTDVERSTVANEVTDQKVIAVASDYQGKETINESAEAHDPVPSSQVESVTEVPQEQSKVESTTLYSQEPADKVVDSITKEEATNYQPSVESKVEDIVVADLQKDFEYSTEKQDPVTDSPALKALYYPLVPLVNLNRKFEDRYQSEEETQTEPIFESKKEVTTEKVDQVTAELPYEKEVAKAEPVNIKIKLESEEPKYEAPFFPLKTLIADEKVVESDILKVVEPKELPHPINEPIFYDQLRPGNAEKIRPEKYSRLDKESPRSGSEDLSYNPDPVTEKVEIVEPPKEEEVYTTESSYKEEESTEGVEPLVIIQAVSSEGAYIAESLPSELEDPAPETSLPEKPRVPSEIKITGGYSTKKSYSLIGPSTESPALVYFIEDPVVNKKAKTVPVTKAPETSDKNKDTYLDPADILVQQEVVHVKKESAEDSSSEITVLTLIPEPVNPQDNSSNTESSLINDNTPVPGTIEIVIDGSGESVLAVNQQPSKTGPESVPCTKGKHNDGPDHLFNTAALAHVPFDSQEDDSPEDTTTVIEILQIPVVPESTIPTVDYKDSYPNNETSTSPSVEQKIRKYTPRRPGVGRYFTSKSPNRETVTEPTKPSNSPVVIGRQTENRKPINGRLYARTSSIPQNRPAPLPQVKIVPTRLRVPSPASLRSGKSQLDRRFFIGRPPVSYGRKNEDSD